MIGISIPVEEDFSQSMGDSFDLDESCRYYFVFSGPFKVDFVSHHGLAIAILRPIAPAVKDHVSLVLYVDREVVVDPSDDFQWNTVLLRSLDVEAIQGQFEARWIRPEIQGLGLGHDITDDRPSEIGFGVGGDCGGGGAGGPPRLVPPPPYQ